MKQTILTLKERLPNVKHKFIRFSYFQIYYELAILFISIL